MFAPQPLDRGATCADTRERVEQRHHQTVGQLRERCECLWKMFLLSWLLPLWLVVIRRLTQHCGPAIKNKKPTSLYKYHYVYIKLCLTHYSWHPKRMAELCTKYASLNKLSGPMWMQTICWFSSSTCTRWVWMNSNPSPIKNKKCIQRLKKMYENTLAKKWSTLHSQLVLRLGDMHWQCTNLGTATHTTWWKPRGLLSNRLVATRP